MDKCTVTSVASADPPDQVAPFLALRWSRRSLTSSSRSIAFYFAQKLLSASTAIPSTFVYASFMTPRHTSTLPTLSYAHRSYASESAQPFQKPRGSYALLFSFIFELCSLFFVLTNFFLFVSVPASRATTTCSLHPFFYRYPATVQTQTPAVAISRVYKLALLFIEEGIAF